MKVTVLIATRNRSEGLRGTLESLFSSTNFAIEDWEAVVVDNGSTDSTPDLCAAFRARYPTRFHAYRENKKGKSNALNLGISVARGEILALTDDDVVCAPGYIAGIQHVFEHYPVDAVQGRIFLDCEGGVPPWMSPTLLICMSLCDYGDTMQIPFRHALFGTNMAVRTDAARAVGGFSPELGAGSAVGFSEDTFFSMKLFWAGYRIIYAPQIVVRHQLPGYRLTRSFFRTRYFQVGRSDAYYRPYPTPLWRFGVHVAKNWVLSNGKAWRALCLGQQTEALDCQCEARKELGFFWQHFLFWYGVPRQLTQVTSWPKLEHDESPVATFPPNLPQDCTQGLIRSGIGKG